MKTVLAGIALASFAVSGANATIYTQTYSGIVVPYDDGTDAGETAADYDNLFGGGSLLGAAFTATFLWDDSVGVITNDATTHEIGGGPFFGNGAASPNLLTTLTINGHSLSYVGSSYGDLYTSATATAPQVVSFTYQDVGQLALGISGPGYAVYAAPSWNFAGDLPAGVDAGGNFLTNDEEIGFSVTSYSIAPVSDNAAIPEPASWAMMLGGFGLIGGAMRSRRKAAVASAESLIFE